MKGEVFKMRESVRILPLNFSIALREVSRNE